MAVLPPLRALQLNAITFIFSSHVYPDLVKKLFVIDCKPFTGKEFDQYWTFGLG